MLILFPNRDWWPGTPISSQVMLSSFVIFEKKIIQYLHPYVFFLQFNQDKSQTLDFRGAQMEEAGLYRCVLQNKCGKAETKSYLMVAGMLKFFKNLSNLLMVIILKSIKTNDFIFRCTKLKLGSFGKVHQIITVFVFWDQAWIMKFVFTMF